MSKQTFLQFDERSYFQPLPDEKVERITTLLFMNEDVGEELLQNFFKESLPTIKERIPIKEAGIDDGARFDYGIFEDLESFRKAVKYSFSTPIVDNNVQKMLIVKDPTGSCKIFLNDKKHSLLDNLVIGFKESDIPLYFATYFKNENYVSFNHLSESQSLWLKKAIKELRQIRERVNVKNILENGEEIKTLVNYSDNFLSYSPLRDVLAKGIKEIDNFPYYKITVSSTGDINEDFKKDFEEVLDLNALNVLNLGVRHISYPFVLVNENGEIGEHFVKDSDRTLKSLLKEKATPDTQILGYGIINFFLEENIPQEVSVHLTIPSNSNDQERLQSIFRENVFGIRPAAERKRERSQEQEHSRGLSR